MIYRIIIISVIMLEFFGCSSTVRQDAENAYKSECYDSSFMKDNSECLDSEIISLESDLSNEERVIRGAFKFF